jgi:hypothetical protein
MTIHHEISTLGAKQFSPARKRWENAHEKLRSAVGATLTRELFYFSVPTLHSLLALSELREGRLRVSVSLSSLNLSWSAN